MIKVTKLLLESLLNNNDPIIQYKTRVYVLGEDPSHPNLVNLQGQILKSPIITMLLSERDGNGKIPHHPYKKWTGAHWVLTHLAELDYPQGDTSLLPLRDQVYEWLFSQRHQDSILSIQGRVRRCASQEANALFSSLALGLTDERTEKLAQNLLHWQWPDGGWNCDKKPDAYHSSFFETHTPLRALSLYSQITGAEKFRKAVENAAEVFIKRSLFRSQTTGKLISPEFLNLHYPVYWHYDILSGLMNIASVGCLSDIRCKEALDILESKQLPDGGFPAESRFYQGTKPDISNFSIVNWGGVSKKKSNPWVTIYALSVLKQAGRLSLIT
ncbi:MAG: hypothetical protein MUO40_01290 [Anaerolineaceae bacterium]|nr:hypothetical protein [Anaerolineaceae bacterium]